METFILITIMGLVLVTLLMEVSPTPVPSSSIIFYTRLNQNNESPEETIQISSKSKCSNFNALEWQTSSIRIKEGVCVNLYADRNCVSSTRITIVTNRSLTEMQHRFIKPHASMRLCANTATVGSTNITLHTTATNFTSTIRTKCENLSYTFSSIKLPNGACVKLFQSMDCQGAFKNVTSTANLDGTIKSFQRC